MNLVLFLLQDAVANYGAFAAIGAGLAAIGGGIGITPGLSMLNHIVETGSRRETWFFLGIKNPN